MDNRHIITDKERGHRKPLSDEPTVSYTIKMPESLRVKCYRLGAEWVRKILKQPTPKPKREEGTV